ncbi:MAG TPA: STAS domain-containing protein [Caulobacteraceae bacterium]|nr:STAS domain-containing protein [Caulobacteraceae bacterium]
MQIDKTDLGGSVTRLTKAGRLDISGAAAAEMPLGFAAKSCRALIIDMSQVSFVASLGVRHLLTAAKILGRSGGKLVLFAAIDPVADVLETMGVTDLIAMTPSEKDALDLVGEVGG